MNIEERLIQQIITELRAMREMLENIQYSVIPSSEYLEIILKKLEKKYSNFDRFKVMGYLLRQEALPLRDKLEHDLEETYFALSKKMDF